MIGCGGGVVLIRVSRLQSVRALVGRVVGFGATAAGTAKPGAACQLELGIGW